MIKNRVYPDRVAWQEANSDAVIKAGGTTNLFNLEARALGECRDLEMITSGVLGDWADVWFGNNGSENTIENNWFHVQLSLDYAPHYARLTHKGMITYYPNFDALLAGKRTEIKPGKFFMKFFQTEDGQQPDSAIVRDFSNWAKKDAGRHELRFAQDADTIQKVYIEGPRSCMSGTDENLMQEVQTELGNVEKLHCSAVYESPDLEVAYLVDKSVGQGRIVARALVDCRGPQKFHTSIYGDIALMRTFLTDAGIERGNQGDFIGCRLRMLPVMENKPEWAIDRSPSKTTYLMPFLDCANYLEKDGAWFAMCHDYDDKETFGCSRTDGILSIEYKGNERYCDSCDEYLHEDAFVGFECADAIDLTTTDDFICEDCLSNLYTQSGDHNQDDAGGAGAGAYYFYDDTYLVNYEGFAYSHHGKNTVQASDGRWYHKHDVATVTIDGVELTVSDSRVRDRALHFLREELNSYRDAYMRIYHSEGKSLQELIDNGTISATVLTIGVPVDLRDTETIRNATRDRELADAERQVFEYIDAEVTSRYIDDDNARAQQ